MPGFDMMGYLTTALLGIEWAWNPFYTLPDEFIRRMWNDLNTIHKQSISKTLASSNIQKKLIFRSKLKTVRHSGCKDCSCNSACSLCSRPASATKQRSAQTVTSGHRNKYAMIHVDDLHIFQCRDSVVKQLNLCLTYTHYNRHSTQ